MRISAFGAVLALIPCIASAGCSADEAAGSSQDDSGDDLRRHKWDVDGGTSSDSSTSALDAADGGAVSDGGAASSPDSGTSSSPDAGATDGATPASCTGAALNPGANVAAAISNASPGSVICLNAGDYGSATLTNVVKTSDVVLQSVSGNTASISLTVTDSTHLKFQNLTIGGMSISGSNAKNITVSGNTFTSQLWVITTDFNNNNILIDRNTFDGIDANGGIEGRLSITWPNGPGSVPAGVTVTNNHFGKLGCSDGIQVGSYGVVIGPGNIFVDSDQGSCVEHVDSIQLYGQSHTTIDGNFFYNDHVCIGAYDGGNSEVVTNNVFVATGGTRICVLDFGSITNLTFSHNTILGADPRIGGINYPTGTTGSMLNNILLGGAFNTSSGDGCTSCAFDHNLFDSSGNASGTNTIIGTPTFVGGTTPATWAGYALASTSVGYRAASDGKDVGATSFGP